jgi:hypothetical protein
MKHRWQRSREVFDHRVELGDGQFYPSGRDWADSACIVAVPLRCRLQLQARSQPESAKTCPFPGTVQKYCLLLFYDKDAIGPRADKKNKKQTALLYCLNFKLREIRTRRRFKVLHTEIYSTYLVWVSQDSLDCPCSVQTSAASRKLPT